MIFWRENCALGKGKNKNPWNSFFLNREQLRVSSMCRYDYLLLWAGYVAIVPSGTHINNFAIQFGRSRHYSQTLLEQEN